MSGVTKRKGGLVIIRDEAWWWGVGPKREILAWRNYWTAPRVNYKHNERGVFWVSILNFTLIWERKLLDTLNGNLERNIRWWFDNVFIISPRSITDENLLETYTHKRIIQNLVNPVEHIRCLIVFWMPLCTPLNEKR